MSQRSDEFDEFDELLALARRLAAEAAALLLDGLHRPRADVGTKSSGTDMVTDMDRASERLIVDGIRAARPDDGIVSEEGATASATSGVVWVVDPIDGTTNYLYGIPGFAVSIAAEIDGRPVVGVVNDPVNGEEFSAVRGRGARRNGETISPTLETDLAHALVATGFAYAADRRRHQAEVLTHILDRVRDIRRLGAASVDLCSVACGRVDGYYEWGLSHWDVAAGLLIAEEAGALAAPIAGVPAGFRPLLVGAPGVFRALHALVTGAVAATHW
jgi:myo-inositol-1(or 4)-monophosphatase